MIAVKVSQPQRSRVATEVRWVRWASHSTMSSKSRVCRAAGPRPGQFLGAHPALWAIHPADLIDQPQPVDAQVQVSPAAPPAVIDRRAHHAARAVQQPGAWVQGDFDVVLTDG